MSSIEIEIYQADNGTVEVRLERETIWLSLQQLSDLFERDKSVISRHLRNIYKNGELIESATVAKNATVQTEGGRQVKRLIELYNLDAIISVGYRVNSGKATRFRQWASSVLRQHLTQGYSLNRQRLQANAKELETALLLDQGCALVVLRHQKSSFCGWQQAKRRLFVCRFSGTQ